MNLRVSVIHHGVVSVLVLALCLLPFVAAAQSRDVQALEQRMADAEQRYREALVLIGNSDPTGIEESNAALEDMEDAILACESERDCRLGNMLAAYKRLLKQNADAQVQPLAENAGNSSAPDHHGPAYGLAGDVPQAARAAKLLSGEHDFDEMVQFNPAIQQSIRRWLTDMRDDLMTSHENYQYLRHLMWPYYQRAGLPEALLFGILAKESNGRVHSTSRAGAAGPMQFMYATGKRFGLGVDATGFDTRYDPSEAARASVAYLNERMSELNRSIELSLAGYNGGEGRARRAFESGGGRGFWSAEVHEQFPPETQDYVPMVIAAAWLFLHPEQYGLEFPEVDARLADVTLVKPATIYELTICLGNDDTRNGYMRALRNLNPRYRADDWLPAGTTLHASRDIASLYKRWCVNGPRAELAQRLVTSDPMAAIVHGAAPLPPAVAPVIPPPPRMYSSQRGETVYSIAKKFECAVETLAQVNGLEVSHLAIRPGQRLRLEGCRDL